MPTPTYVALATVTLVGSDAEVVFSSIPASYRDLVLVYSGTGSAAGGYYVTFNSSSTSNYSRVTMSGYSTTTESGSFSNSIWMETGTTESTTILDIMDYSATDKHKTVLSRSQQDSSFVTAIAGRWADTSAISSVYLFGQGANTFEAGSTFSLFGIEA